MQIKTYIIFFVLTFTGFVAMAQGHIALAEKDNFKTLALSKNEAGVPIIKKWIVPVRYKVYSQNNAYSITEIDSIMAQVRDLTNLDIAAAPNESDVNFSIYLGGKTDFGNQIPEVAVQSFSKYGGTYYKFNGKGEIYNATDLITVANFTDAKDVRNALRKSITKLFGFFNPLENLPNSIFYSQSNNVVRFDPYDSFLIRLLYSPRFTPGMNMAEVDAALNKM